eukprot:3793797-Prymnesium_polylepis.1
MRLLPPLHDPTPRQQQVEFDLWVGTEPAGLISLSRTRFEDGKRCPSGWNLRLQHNFYDRATLADYSRGLR